MATSLVRLDPTGADRGTLVAFLTSNDFPFHVGSRRSTDEVEEAIEAGAFRDGDNDSYWIDHPQHGRVGFLRFEDLSEDTPMFDLRLAEPMRGRGLGTEALRAAIEHIFTTIPARRFEGQTREDNIAMRRTFLQCGFLKEAHYREGWPVTGGAPLASVAYAILRRDWETGTTTRFTWEDITI